MGSFAEELKKAFVKSGGKTEDALKTVMLLTQDGCGGCDLAHEYLKEEIERGDIKTCNLKDNKCKAIADELKIKATPAIVTQDDEGKYHECEIKTQDDDFIFECPYLPGDKAPPPEAAKPTLPKHGKIGISCMSNELKNQIGWFLQSQPNVSKDILALVGSLPECAEAESGMPIAVGFSPIKKDRTATETKASNPRIAFMRKCLQDSAMGSSQPERMRKCSARWRESQ